MVIKEYGSWEKLLRLYMKIANNHINPDKKDARPKIGPRTFLPVM